MRSISVIGLFAFAARAHANNVESVRGHDLVEEKPVPQSHHDSNTMHDKGKARQNRKELEAINERHSKELEALKERHSMELKHAQELEALKERHAMVLEAMNERQSQDTKEQKVSLEADSNSTINKLMDRSNIDKMVDKYIDTVTDKMIDKFIIKANAKLKKKKKKKKKSKKSKMLDETMLAKPSHLGYGPPPSEQPPPTGNFFFPGGSGSSDPNDYLSLDLPTGYVGQTKKVTIPADQAYGAEGVGCRIDGNNEKKCVIPPNTPLEFEIKLVERPKSAR